MGTSPRNFLPIRNLRISTDPHFVTEWVHPNTSGEYLTQTILQLSSEKALEIATESARDFFNEYSNFGKDGMIVGASGGGDSNTLLSALAKTSNKKKITVITLTGFPDWTDESVKKATILCDTLGFSHVVVSSNDVAKYCGFNRPLPEVVSSFHSHFGNNELIFLSTFAIQQCLIEKAKEFKMHDIVLGANREDILGEALYYLTAGLLPAQFPVRPFGSHQFGFPLWLVPKKVIDGVHPRFSFDNYIERDPNSPPWRDRFYYLAHIWEDNGFGTDLNFLKGLSTLSEQNTLKNWLIEEQLIEGYTVLMHKNSDNISKKKFIEWFKTVQ